MNDLLVAGRLRLNGEKSVKNIFTVNFKFRCLGSIIFK